MICLQNCSKLLLTNMKQALELDLKSAITLLLIGQPGSGKTSLAMHFPQPCIIDLDDNIQPAARFTGRKDFFYTTISRDDSGKPVEVNQRYNRFEKELIAIAADDKVKTIVIDSLSNLVDLLCWKTKTMGGIAADAQMRIQDWGTFQVLLRNLIVQLKQTGKHIIMTAHVEVEKDDSDNAFKKFIAVPGKSRYTLAGVFSEVWQLYATTEGFGAAQKSVRKVRTVPENLNDYTSLKDSNRVGNNITIEELIKQLQTIAA